MATREPEENGWTPVTAERSNLYFKKAKGAIIVGLLVGRFERGNKKDAYYYQVRVTEPCGVSEYDPESGNSVDRPAAVGEIVNVDETAGLAPLESVANEGTPYLVRVECVEKVKLPGGTNTFWRMKVAKRPAPDDVPF